MSNKIIMLLTEKVLTIRMMQSFEAEATKVLLKFTARSVMSPLKHKMHETEYPKESKEK